MWLLLAHCGGHGFGPWSQRTNPWMLWRRKRPGEETPWPRMGIGCQAEMTVREAQNNHCRGRRDGGRGPARTPCWRHRAHLSLERGDLSTAGCVALNPLILGALSTPMSSCSSRAAAELATSHQAGACAVAGAQIQPPALLCRWQDARSRDLGSTARREKR